MNQLDRIERQAAALAPDGTNTAGSQLDRIAQLLGAALRARGSTREFIPGTGRLGGQHHDHDDTPPADPDTARQALAGARAALHARQP